MKIQTRWLKLLFLLSIVVFTILACGGSTPVVSTPQAEDSGSGEQTQSVEDEVPVGTTRSNPAPYGYEITSGDITFKITEIVRPADDTVRQGNMFNKQPEGGQEYIFVQIEMTCNRDPDDSCNVFLVNFKLIGSSGVAREAEWFITGVDGLLERTEFYGNATETGYIPFILDIGETDLVLSYEPILGTQIYLSAEP